MKAHIFERACPLLFLREICPPKKGPQKVAPILWP
jgi:hypothetical protein